MGRTTIQRNLIEEIKLGTADKQEVLRQLADAADGAEALRSGTPAVTVKFYVSAKPAAPKLARGTLTPSDDGYELMTSAPLYVLDDPLRADVIRFGRHPNQDVQLLDRLVSREHGLVIYAGSVPLFCDYGTLRDGARSGSMNGTFIDGVVPIRDTMIQWLPFQALMLGATTTDRQGNMRFAIKITYELHRAPPVAN